MALLGNEGYSSSEYYLPIFFALSFLATIWLIVYCARHYKGLNVKNFHEKTRWSNSSFSDDDGSGRPRPNRKKEGMIILHLVFIAHYALATNQLSLWALLEFIPGWNNPIFCYLQYFAFIYTRNAASLWCLSLIRCLLEIGINHDSKNGSRFLGSEEKKRKFIRKTCLYNYLIPVVPALIFLLIQTYGPGGDSSGTFSNYSPSDDGGISQNCYWNVGGEGYSNDYTTNTIATVAYFLIPLIASILSILGIFYIWFQLRKRYLSLSLLENITDIFKQRKSYFYLRNYVLSIVFYPCLNVIIVVIFVLIECIPSFSTNNDLWTLINVLISLQGSMEVFIFFVVNYRIICTSRATLEKQSTTKTFLFKEFRDDSFNRASRFDAHTEVSTPNTLDNSLFLNYGEPTIDTFDDTYNTENTETTGVLNRPQQTFELQNSLL